MSDTDRQLAATRTLDGHELWHEIVAKHGVDRCPTVEGQALWACGELGELAQEIEKQIFAGRDPHQLRDSPEIRKELGDAGPALHGLAIKLGLDLGEEMAAVVRGETRRFT